MTSSSHQTQLQALGDQEVLGLALASGELTHDGRAHLAEELTRRGLLPEVAKALQGAEEEWASSQRDALVERTRARRCPMCAASWAALEAKVVNRNSQALLAMLSSVVLAALVQDPDSEQFTIVGCPSCLGMSPDAPASAPPSDALIQFVSTHRHLLEAFDDRPDLVDAILGRNTELLSSRLSASMAPEWQVEPLRGAPSKKMVAVEQLRSRSDAVEAMHLLNAANIEAHVQQESGGETAIFTVLVPQVHANLAKASLNADSDGQDAALDFCFHCGGTIETGATKCPECGGDLSD